MRSKMVKTNQTTVNYLGGFAATVFLFFIIGFLTTANTQFQAPLKEAFLSHAGSLRNTLITLIVFSWFLAYPVFGSVGSYLVNHRGYKMTLLIGLFIMLSGLCLFFLSSWITTRYLTWILSFREGWIPVGYLFFLLGSFIVGGSATVLQVVINPYASACQVKGTSNIQRMAIGGTANSLGTTLAPYFVSSIVFSGLALQEISVRQLQLPFLGLIAVIMLLIVLVSRFTLPDIPETHTLSGERLEKSVWSFRHLTLGVVAIFFYVGCEVCVGGNINLYVIDDLGLSMNTATLMATLYWGGLLIGRLLSSFVHSISPRTQLTTTAIGAIVLVLLTLLTNCPWLLVAVGLCHSIMWGAIFTLSTKQLGKYTSAASGVFMIGVVGGAILPLVQGAMADSFGSWMIVLLGEIVILLYAQIGSRIKKNA